MNMIPEVLRYLEVWTKSETSRSCLFYENFPKCVTSCEEKCEVLRDHGNSIVVENKRKIPREFLRGNYALTKRALIGECLKNPFALIPLKHRSGGHVGKVLQMLSSESSYSRT
jgi:hypothetical protein